MNYLQYIQWAFINWKLYLIRKKPYRTYIFEFVQKSKVVKEATIQRVWLKIDKHNIYTTREIN